MEDLIMYTTEEVAEITKQSRMTIYRHIKSGQLKANKIGKHWKISKEQLKEYIEGE